MIEPIDTDTESFITPKGYGGECVHQLWTALRAASILGAGYVVTHKSFDMAIGYHSTTFIPQYTSMPSGIYRIDQLIYCYLYIMDKDKKEARWGALYSYEEARSADIRGHLPLGDYQRMTEDILGVIFHD